MIKREFTNTYLADLDLLTENLYLCWLKAYNLETNSIDKSLLKELIVSHGFYNDKHITKKDSYTNFTNQYDFKHLTWVNQFLEQINQDRLSNQIEFYKQVISEIEANLFVLKSKSAQIAYANILLRDFDKSHIHKRKLDVSERNRLYKETFEIILDCRANAETHSQNTPNPGAITNYDLSIRLINHLDFIDKLIELFLCFEIDLIAMAEKHRRNLYIFDSNKNNFSDKRNWGNKSIGTVILKEKEVNYSNSKVFSKFQSKLSNDCLINIMHYLYKKKKLEKPNIEIWLYWFNRKCVRIPETLKWKGSPTLLSNIIQQLCGESIATVVKTAFNTNTYYKPTKSKYEHSRIHKEIEQIITISKQKTD